ncbi:MAG: hypothetical protein ACK49D_06475 [Flavobacteriia bacterium]|jgi:hypothetical protein|nr:hypothetical protein [Cryomorphaceae bacterium]
MKQTILTIALTAVCSLSQAQIKAITENGEEVVLFENGQWEYTEGNEYVEEEILMNPVKFTRPATSAFLLKSTKFNVGTYLDSKKWTIEKGKGDDAYEYQLTLNQGDLYAMMITEQVEIPLESLKAIALENARDVAPDVYVVKEEYRMVNGLRVLMMQMNGTLSGIKFSYYGYYFSSEKGTIQFIGYTSQNLLSKYQKTIEDLLNGLVQY